METRALLTSDGATITADVSVPSGAWHGIAVLCHPHPAYGGSRFDRVVSRLFTTLPAHGWSAVRFDFRTPPDDDRLPVVADADLTAALDLACDETGDRAGRRLVLVGYSYGAVAALRSLDRRIAGIAAIAPPLSVLPVGRPPTVPTLLITADHDQFTPTDVVDDLTASWTQVTRTNLVSADHFLHGQVETVAGTVTGWLNGRETG